ncbi:MAG TPA: DUF721 domain-containing protein, partial [Terriglobia bacterium]|nr:DUF721 domain-containing protein [Terriglobia bacterium]
GRPVLNFLPHPERHLHREAPMEEIGNILPSIFKKKILGRSAPFLEALRPLWPRAVGKLIAQNTHPVAFTGGLLSVDARSPSWAVQLQQMSETVRAQINSFVGGPVVRKLRVRYQANWSDAAPPLAIPPDLPPSRPRSSPPLEHAGLSSELAQIVERSFVKYFSPGAKRMN